MSNKNTVRNEVNRIAQQIEVLARQVQDSLAAGTDPMGLANELVRNSSTFTFALGEMYATEDGKKAKKVTTVSNPNGTPTPSTVNRKYHNVRDSLGRFTKV